MKLLIFSDIHGNGSAFEAFVRDLQSIEYDRAVFCGDIFGYYYHPREVYDGLQKINNLIWIKGNHDDYAYKMMNGMVDLDELVKRFGHSYAMCANEFSIQDMEYLNCKQSWVEMIDEIGNKILLCHGTPGCPLEGRLYPNSFLSEDEYFEYRFVILGHTHCRMDRTVGNTRIINSGSLGQPRDGSGFGYAVLDTVEDELKFYNVFIDMSNLYAEIDLYDPELQKLKKVLER